MVIFEASFDAADPNQFRDKHLCLPRQHFRQSTSVYTGLLTDFLLEAHRNPFAYFLLDETNIKDGALSPLVSTFEVDPHWCFIIIRNPFLVYQINCRNGQEIFGLLGR